MLPTDILQSPPAVRHVDRLVPDIPEVPRTIATHQIKHLLRPHTSHQSRNRRIRPLLIPSIHRRHKLFTRLARLRHCSLHHRSHRPITLLHIPRLRALKIIKRPENRQPAISIRRIPARQMRRVYHQHRMKFKPHRPRLDISNSRQQQRRQHLPVSRPLLDPPRHLLQQPFPGRLLQQPHQGLDLRTKPDRSRINLGFLGTNRRQAGNQTCTRQKCARRAGAPQEPPSSLRILHDQSNDPPDRCGPQARTPAPTD